jgi:hypothetical protein
MIIQVQVVKHSHNKVSFTNYSIEIDAVVRVDDEGAFNRVYFNDGTTMLIVPNDQLRGLLSTPELIEEVFDPDEGHYLYKTNNSGRNWTGGSVDDKTIPTEEEPPITLRPKKRRL